AATIRARAPEPIALTGVAMSATMGPRVADASSSFRRMQETLRLQPPLDGMLPDRPSILVITLRRLGDVLMTTPLIRTLRRRWPQAALEVLVFSGSERMLKGNPDIDRIPPLPPRPATAEMIALARQLWRRYDLAVSTQAGDRPTFLAWLAGRRR